MIRTTGTRRRGTTLVEVMIAAAMLMLGMWLLVWLYQQGMNGFLTAKAQADLTSQERMVESVMTTDLSRNHFLEDETKPNRGRRVSDQRLDLLGYEPPRAGFFWARSLPTPVEATDSDGFTSSRSVNHALQFTSLVPGGPDHLMFGVEVPARSGQQWYGTAAEITYALVPSSRRTPDSSVLYDLIRRQRLTARTTDDAPAYQPVVNSYSATDNVAEVMTVSGGTMRTLADLTHPANRLRAADWSLTNGRRAGEERLSGNVLSMEIKFSGPRRVIGSGAWPSDPSATEWPRPLAGNSDYPFDFLPYNGEFDTYTRLAAYGSNQYAGTAANTHALPLKPLRITSVMIRVRVFNPQNQATRQTTFVVPL